MQPEIQSVGRSFYIIEYLSSESEPQTLKTIAHNCSLPSSTAHRLLSNLCSLGYVSNDGNGQYKLTIKLFELSSRSVAKTSLISAFKPYLDELGERVNECIYLVIRDESYVVNIYNVTRAIGSLQMASRVGLRLPMYRTAVGKVLLASMDDSKVKELISSCDFSPITAKTITDPTLLLASIQDARRKGYAIDDEENEDGVICFASAIVPQGGEAIYAFGVSTIKSLVSDQHRQEIIKALLETRAAIEQLLFLF